MSKAAFVALVSANQLEMPPYCVYAAGDCARPRPTLARTLPPRPGTTLGYQATQSADAGLGFLIFDSRLWMATDKIFIGIVYLGACSA
jgi:hypothetical protein